MNIDNLQSTKGAWMVLAVAMLTGPTCPAQGQPANPLPGDPRLIPSAYAGDDLSVVAGEPVHVQGQGSSPDDYIVTYEWDFDGDGTYDWQSPATAEATHIYDMPGVYRAWLRVTDSFGRFAIDTIEIQVDDGRATIGAPEVSDIVTAGPPTGERATEEIERYALIINGGYEVRFWEDVQFIHSTLVEYHQFDEDRVYLLHHEGTNPNGSNPGGMIDRAATRANVDWAFSELSRRVDSNDELIVWVTDHGRGYHGPLTRNGVTHGYLDSRASVEPGDEQDFRERDFKLRSLFTGGRYIGNHGLEEWRVYESRFRGTHRMLRHKYVSHFAALYIESEGGVVSDDDVFIERLVDFLEGDFNEDGIIDWDAGELIDFDGDGLWAYDESTGRFDPGDWGAIDSLESVDNINTLVPGGSYVVFDAGLDNRLDIDLNPDPHNLTVDGTDLDNAGLFDGLDVNGDGDMADWISIDESILLADGPLYDDEMAQLLGDVDVAVSSTVMETCFSGGFVDDLSRHDRIIATATMEDCVSWGNAFVRGFASAFRGSDFYGRPVNADTDGNNRVSMQEAFNHAAENDPYDEIPQYDDNGDGLSHSYPMPKGGDGGLGAWVYLSDDLPVGDFDRDGDIDIDDVTILLSFLRRLAVGAVAEMDLDGDGMISVADARRVVLLCTRPRCRS